MKKSQHIQGAHVFIGVYELIDDDFYRDPMFTEPTVRDVYFAAEDVVALTTATPSMSNKATNVPEGRCILVQEGKRGFTDAMSETDLKRLYRPIDRRPDEEVALLVGMTVLAFMKGQDVYKDLKLAAVHIEGPLPWVGKLLDGLSEILRNR